MPKKESTDEFLAEAEEVSRRKAALRRIFARQDKLKSAARNRFKERSQQF